MKDRLRTAEHGADTAVWLAISPAALQQPSGLFFQGESLQQCVILSCCLLYLCMFCLLACLILFVCFIPQFTNCKAVLNKFIPIFTAICVVSPCSQQTRWHIGLLFPGLFYDYCCHTWVLLTFYCFVLVAADYQRELWQYSLELL